MKELRYSTKLRIKDENDAGRYSFGRGAMQLLYGIKEFHSLNAAAKHLNMAYSKAWKVIKGAEECIGVELLDRQGKNGSMLTKEAEEIFEVYAKAEKAANEAAGKVLSEYFDSIKEEKIRGKDGF